MTEQRLCQECGCPWVPIDRIQIHRVIALCLPRDSLNRCGPCLQELIESAASLLDHDNFTAPQRDPNLR